MVILMCIFDIVCFLFGVIDGVVDGLVQDYICDMFFEINGVVVVCDWINGINCSGNGCFVCVIVQVCVN